MNFKKTYKPTPSSLINAITVKTCINCGSPLDNRVDNIEMHADLNICIYRLKKIIALKENDE